MNVTCSIFNFLSFVGIAGRVDKYDSSFQRSRSSSMSSLENITTETISCLTFADSYTKKSGTSMHHCSLYNELSRLRGMFFYSNHCASNCSFIPKDISPVPTLWIGTSLGSIQTVIFNTPVRGDRHAHPAVVSSCSKYNFFY